MNRMLMGGLALAVAGCMHTPEDLPTQADVDLNRYVGTWYEQARLPHRFQKDCASDVRADYVLRPDGVIGVTNQCRTAQGDVKQATAEGRLARLDPPNPAILEVRFAPAWTGWLPFVWGDYWIIKVAGDYQHALVGTPNREYLWVLSRDKQAEPAVVEALLSDAAALGFPVAEVVKSRQ